MRFRLEYTLDGSPTLFDAEAGECFKSRHAAATEAEAVFYCPGVRENPHHGNASPFSILELGFGLGTNFSHACRVTESETHFTSVDRDLSGARAYLEHVRDEGLQEILEKKNLQRGHLSARLLEMDFFEAFTALKGQCFHAVFFDPFSPKANPSAWTEKVFRECFKLLAPGGRLVTYSVSRVAKDGLTNSGFRVEKRDLPKILQKRNALLAIKP